MVRALPVASDFLISLVCLRVSVILFLDSTEPCDLRRYSSSLALSCSERESSAMRFSTPAARNCSSRTEGGTFNSLANWATLVWATLLGPFQFRRFRFISKPVRPGRHDQSLGALRLHARHLGEFIHREVGKVIAFF